MLKKYFFTLCLASVIFGYSSAQNVTILPSGISPVMSGTYPRLSYDALVALPSPQAGDIAYDTTFLCLRVYNGSKWVCTYQNPSNPTANMAAIATAGGIYSDVGYGIAVDASGNVYITGNFNGTSTFGATSKTSAGINDIFVAKYNNAGTLQWVQTAGGTDLDSGNGIAVDASGNVYITGYFNGTATFGTTPKTSIGSYDIFVAKYNNAGSFQWVQTAGGTSNDVGNGIAVDASGNVYITGFFKTTATFGATSKTSAGGIDIFVAKYNNAGTLQWVQTAGGIGNDSAWDIAVDASGNAYLIGNFIGTATFGATSKTSAGGIDIFVAKYNNAGTLQWVQTAGGTDSDVGNGIALDAYGNVYITGDFYGTTTFETASKTSAGWGDIFVAKYSNAGFLQWMQAAGGADEDSGHVIAVDASGNVYITGDFYGTATFGTASKTSAGLGDIFVAKYNNAGSFQLVQTAGGTSSDVGNDIAVDASGNVYITGYFYYTVTYGATTKTSTGYEDIFVARLQN